MVLGEILGQERAVAALRAALRAGRPAPAYLFLGPEGTGRGATALALASALLCEGRGEGCGRCGACRRVEAGAHPDVHRLEPDPEGTDLAIKVDQVREASRLLHLKAFEGGAKILLVDPAERMTRDAANAFLKTLEDPPEGAHAVLLARSRGAVPPTVASRCQAVLFGPLPREAIERILEERLGIPSETARSLAPWCGGSVAQARSLDPAAIERIRDLKGRIRTLDSSDARGVLAIAAEIAPRHGAHPERTLEGIIEALRKDLVASAGSPGTDALVALLEGGLRARRNLLGHANALLTLEAWLGGSARE